MIEGGAPINFDSMTQSQFEEHLPELFATSNGRISDDPSLTRFLDAHPDCAALVRDLEYIADAARSLLEPAIAEPSDSVWNSIQGKLKIAAAGDEP